MMPGKNGSIHLFRLFGISVYVHWTWFVVAYLFYSTPGIFGHGAYFVLTYGSLFAIVLMHEFGHALACRSVGGRAEQIILWPLGGVAYVDPPPRPGAVLWSIVAGPLVNVILLPITLAAVFGANALTSNPYLLNSIYTIFGINLSLLLFNILPIYPLDGGQILQSLLWFKMGRARSLKLASTIGLVVAVFVAVFLIGSGAVFGGGMWLFVLALFIGLQAWEGRRAAEMMIKMEDHSWSRIQELARNLASRPPH